MNDKKSKTINFVNFLINNRENNGFLSDLKKLSYNDNRRLLGLRHIINFISYNEEAYCFVAEQFAHSRCKYNQDISLPKALSILKYKNKFSASLESKFDYMLSSSNILPDFNTLNCFIRILINQNMYFDWQLLLRDLCHWGDYSSWVQKNWIKEFHGKLDIGEDL